MSAERVTEHVSHGHRYRLREHPDGTVSVERRDPDGWTWLDDREAAAVLDRLRTGRPPLPFIADGDPGPVLVTYTEPRGASGTPWTSPPQRFASRAAAQLYVDAVTGLGGRDAAARRTWTITPAGPSEHREDDR